MKEIQLYGGNSELVRLLVLVRRWNDILAGVLYMWFEIVMIKRWELISCQNGQRCDTKRFTSTFYLSLSFDFFCFFPCFHLLCRLPSRVLVALFYFSARHTYKICRCILLDRYSLVLVSTQFRDFFRSFFLVLLILYYVTVRSGFQLQWLSHEQTHNRKSTTVVSDRREAFVVKS